ncbi:hypothetical protein NUW58_g10761 [Xylaria curta]|uniref:Uncharacterized protein n=1 Tax=Xylaria curta TaxID=42375 RepID=A0ACC1MIH8_9PEZI|nr:hypothetical protein NUW58_g10761 [Xylaria curta]
MKDQYMLPGRMYFAPFLVGSKYDDEIDKIVVWDPPVVFPASQGPAVPLPDRQEPEHPERRHRHHLAEEARMRQAADGNNDTLPLVHEGKGADEVPLRVEDNIHAAGRYHVRKPPRSLIVDNLVHEAGEILLNQRQLLSRDRTR